MASTSSSDYWTGLLDNVTGLGLDYARTKLIDVQNYADESNLPDRADLWYYGSNSAKQRQAASGMSMGKWLLIGGAAVLGLVLLRRFRVL